MKKVFIIGFGNMGQATGKALAKARGFKVFAYDKNRNKVKATAGISFARLGALKKADVIIVAVKPQDVPALAGQLLGKINLQTILISIAAGLSIKKLAALFHLKKIVRMMPNLGLSVGQGIAAWKSAGLSSADKKIAKHILNGITENFEVKNEALIDAVTAISGSGPAYFFFLAGALLSSAITLGLNPAQSRLLVEKTMSAAAKLQKGVDYQELIKRVRSKKGTTDAALKVFQKRSVDKIVAQAVKAAYLRAKELSRG
jgi:pyrroline-5-carboxylate reductase